MAQLDQFTFFRGRVAEAAILKALGIGRGDEVAIQAFTCVAVPEGVIAAGAQPVYVDIAANRLTMDPADLERKLTPATRAIVVQHSFGLPTDMAGIARVAAARGLPIIEDCAHAVGSTVGGRDVGSLGVAAFYSFEASKPVFVGIGGSAQVNDAALAERVRRDYGAYGQPPLATQAQVLVMYAAHRIAYRPATFWQVRALFRRVSGLGLIPGSYNKVETDLAPAEDFRRSLGNLQRRLLPGAIARLASDIPHRRWVAAQYRTRLTAPGLEHLAHDADADPVYGRYPMLANNKDDILRRAPEFRVEVASWYATAVHPLEGPALAAVGYVEGSCPRAEAVTSRIISLPTSALVTEPLIERTVRLLGAP